MGKGLLIGFIYFIFDILKIVSITAAVIWGVVVGYALLCATVNVLTMLNKNLEKKEKK